MRRWRRWLAASAGATCALLLAPTACSTFGESPEPPTGEGGADAGSADVGPAPDVALDAEGGGQTDAPPGASCTSEEVLIGSSVVGGKGEDSVGPDFTDAYGYVALTAGTARCFHFYLTSARTNAVNVGVYQSSETAKPNDRVPTILVAQGTIENPRVGWNVAPLNIPRDVTVGTVLWLAVSPLYEGGADLGLHATENQALCSQRMFLRASTTTNGALPGEFAIGSSYPNFCDMAAYLSP